jgi:dihydroorotate dehydrogenase (NAD+) catalytic subunit
VNKTVDMAVAIGRLRLANPIIVASGTFGYGEEYASLVDVDSLGALVTKGVSLLPRQGNPAPRIAETPSGMLNSIGLQNPGIEVFIQEKLPWLRGLKTQVIVNILGNTIEEYAALAKRLDTVEGVDALEVNISCPNVNRGGIAFGSDPASASDVAQQVRAHTGKPVLVKLSPNVTDLVAVAVRVAETGVDGLTLINTVRGMAIDYRTGRPLLGNVIGGLSGPAIRPIAVRAIYEVSKAVDVAIVGSGGVVEWRNAVEFMRAGASAVQVGSANFRNPKAAIEVLHGLSDYLKQNSHLSARELVKTVILDS